MTAAADTTRAFTRWSAWLGNRTCQMALLAIAVTGASYAGTTLSPLQETVRDSLGLTDDQVAILQGPAMALPMVAASVPLGLIIDRYSRVRLVMLFAVCDLLGTILTALEPGFAVLTFARGLVGFMMLAVNPVAFSLLADLFEPARRGRAMMVLTVGQTVGGAAVFAAGGMLLTTVEPGPNAWRTVMLLLAVPLVPVFLGTLALREPSRTEVVISRPSPRQSFAELWQCRGFVVPIIAGVVCAQTAIGAVFVWTAPVLARTYKLSSDRVGAVMALVSLVSGIAGPVFGGLVADLCQRSGGPRRTVSALAVCALLAIPGGLFAVAPGVAIFSVVVVVFTTLLLACAVMGNVVLTVVVSNEVRGLCLGIFGAVSVIFAFGFAPVLVSRASVIIGGPGMIGTAVAVVCAGMTLLTFMIFAAVVNRFPRMTVHRASTTNPGT